MSFDLGSRFAKLLENRLGEGSGFAGARLGASEDVFPVKNGGNSLGLYGRWMSVTLVGERLEKFGPKTEFFE